MIPGRSPRRFSRRRVLAAAGTIGTIGALSGVTTSALMNDVERDTMSTFRAGALDLELDCRDEQCSVDADGTVRFAFDGLSPGDSGVGRITLEQVGNPAWLWLASTCPATDFEAAIDVSIAFDRGCDGSVEFRLADTLDAVLAELATGVRLAPDCIEGGESGCLTFEWTFRDEPGVRKYQGEALDFELQLFATQCRHSDGWENPYADRDCGGDGRGISSIGIWTCSAQAPDCACEHLGTLELSEAFATGCAEAGHSTAGISENVIEVGRYDLPEDDDCVDTGYDVVVTDTSTNDDGETTAVAFELVDENGDPGPDICTVVLKAGTEEVVHDAPALAPRSNGTDGELLEASR